jgi:hypothetical protein
MSRKWYLYTDNTTVTLTSAWYWAMLETGVDADDVDSELWFQQDGTTTHNTWIDGQFDSYASRHNSLSFVDIIWPDRSPELFAPGYFSLETL